MLIYSRKIETVWNSLSDGNSIWYRCIQDGEVKFASAMNIKQTYLTVQLTIWMPESYLIMSISGYFFSIRVFFHKHSRITGQQGKWEGISLTPHYHFYPLHRHWDISWWLQQRAHLCTKLAAGLEPGTFGFRAQVPNH